MQTRFVIMHYGKYVKSAKSGWSDAKFTTDINKAKAYSEAGLEGIMPYLDNTGFIIQPVAVSVIHYGESKLASEHVTERLAVLQTEFDQLDVQAVENIDDMPGIDYHRWKELRYRLAHRKLMKDF